MSWHSKNILHLSSYKWTIIETRDFYNDQNNTTPTNLWIKGVKVISISNINIGPGHILWQSLTDWTALLHWTYWYYNSTIPSSCDLRPATELGWWTACVPWKLCLYSEALWKPGRQGRYWCKGLTLGGSTYKICHYGAALWGSRSYSRHLSKTNLSETCKRIFSYWEKLLVNASSNNLVVRGVSFLSILQICKLFYCIMTSPAGEVMSKDSNKCTLSSTQNLIVSTHLNWPCAQQIQRHSLWTKMV